MENKSEISSHSNDLELVCGTGNVTANHMARNNDLNAFDKDETGWKDRCAELEKQILDFDARTGRLRELLHEKLQEQEGRVQEATRRAEIAEKELRRVQGGMTPHQNNNNNVKRSKETFQPNSASGPAADKDAIIADLKVKIEQYQEERRQEMKRVEGHSKKIRDWVASKLLQLETKNAVLQSERDLLEGKLASLTKKLQKLEHRAEADDVDICFTGSEYFHNESPDTDEETQLNDADGARQPLKSAPRAMPEVKIERKVFPKDLALSFLSSCDESQATDVNTSRSSEDETQVLVTPAPTSEFKKVENDSRKNDLMEKFLAMKHDDDDDENHTVSALATMPRCKAGELCVPDYSGTNRSKKMKAIDRNYRSSSVAPQMNPQPPTLPLRRVPSWENRIYEVAKAGLKVDQGLPEVRSFHSRTILFYENGGCGSSNVPVFAVTRKRAIKISDSPFSSHSTDKSRTQKILFDVLTTSPTKSHPRQNAESRPHSASVPSSCAPLTAQPGSILSTSTRENSGLVDKMCANFKSPECDADARVDERKISEVAPRDESSLNLENKTQRQPSSPQMQQQQPNDHHHSHLFSQNIDGVSDPDTGACLELMTQSDTSSDYALPPDDGDSNLGFSCRLQQKETCFVCVGVDSRGRQVKDAAAEAGDDDDDDDSADKWAIFEEEVIKAGFLVHLRRDVKGWCECWCIFTGHDLRIYPIKGEQPLSIVALDGGTKVAQSDNTFVLSTRNMRNTFACNSASSSNSWVQVLSESITWLSADGDVSKNLNGDSCFFKSKNGQIEKCWCILQENLLNFYKTPKSQMPYLKLSLNEFRIEELNSIKSNSSSPKFHSLLALWPSSSSSTTASSSSSSDPSPIYLHIPDESGKAKEWFQRILKASTCSVLNASKQGTEYEQCVLKLVSADGVPTSSLWKEPILSFSKAPLAKPLISLPSGDLYKRATDMFKHILDFMSLPIDWSDLDIKLNLVQRIFSLCHHHHHLHNELFCQLMKQTTRSHQQQKSLGNFLCGGHHWFLCDTSPTSPLNSTIETTDPKSPTNSSSHPISIQAWQLLTIALHLFLPNRQSILWMLSKHLQRNADSRSECGKYAVYCQSAMERVQLNGPRSHPPSQLEVLSVLSHNPYHHSQPISIPVHLPNSSYQVVSFDGSTLVSEFLANLNSSMDMRDSNSSGFALFACDSNNPQREVCCLDLNAKVCDILSCLQVLLLKLNSKKSPTTPTIKLLYRNRLYMKSLCRFETEKERLLLAFQFHSQLMEGRFPVTEDLALELVALMAQIEYGDVRPTSELKSSSTSSRSSHSPQHQHILISQVLDRFLPKFILGDSEHDREIEKRLVNSWSLLKGRGTEDCVKVYLTVVRKWPLCGTRMLLAKLKVEATSLDDVWFCVHEDGISVLELKSLKPLYSFGYNLINTFGGYDDDYMFIVVKRNAHSPVAYRRFLFAMAKSEAQEVVLLMVDYIKCRNIHKTHEKPPTKDHNSSALQSR